METGINRSPTIEHQNGIGNTNNVTALVIFVTTFLLSYYYTRRRPGTPPGPPLLPIVGNLFSLAGGDVLKTLRELRHKYGDVFALYIGTELTVFLNGHEVLHDALIKKGSLFLRRPYSNFHKLVVRRSGIVILNDKPWKTQRSIVMKSFNKLFFKNGGYRLRSIIQREAKVLVETLGSSADRNTPIDVGDLLTVSTGNVITDMLFKRRFEFEDKRFLGHLKTLTKLATVIGKSLVLSNCFPFLAKFPGDVLKADEANSMIESVINGMQEYINSCKHDENTFVGLFFKELQSIDPDEYEENETALPTTVIDLLGGGTETTSSTILWTVLYLVKYPDIQNKMYEEISRVKDKGAIIALEYTKHLPYSNAVIYETLRIAAAVPLAIPRSVPRDLNFRGYLLPENCTIVANLNSSLMDPSVWEEPETFRPERFLNESETEVVVPKELIPFSIGRRSCAGESLARMELFVFITSLLANFKFRPLDENIEYDMNGELGASWHPKAFKIKVERR